jgi:hypothetical protein
VLLFLAHVLTVGGRERPRVRRGLVGDGAGHRVAERELDRLDGAVLDRQLLEDRLEALVADAWPHRAFLVLGVAGAGLGEVLQAPR